MISEASDFSELFILWPHFTKSRKKEEGGETQSPTVKMRKQSWRVHVIAQDHSAYKRQMGIFRPECGERPVFERGAQFSRIIGGMEAEVGEFPWQVSIQARNEHFCGGAIINEWWIVSAAHCFHSEISPTELRVVLGTNSLSSPSLEIKGVTSIILHKDFQKLNMDNDISLLLLDTPITFSELKEPICMPTEPGLARWHKCWVAGWGQTQTGLKQPMETELLKVPMTIMDWEKCLKEFPRLTKNMLCAGYENETYDACQGDSGGPLVCTTESGKKWFQVGIISWGKSCGRKNIPGIYTLLENYHSWIKKVTELEGRPFSAEEMIASPEQKSKSSRASEFPEPGSPRFWLLLCLLPYVVF
ncbi:serine protease 55 isoform X1 [Balaenoptera musculus]|uniref:Serine protease 55 isoform X1 n=2 Tax=Balaenoptera musculus TaxID=9771 RepID=A0A8B8XTR4_BALMU|nr:serine protease 55 isoform X1 [Balaenoptera musculus]